LRFQIAITIAIDQFENAITIAIDQFQIAISERVREIPDRDRAGPGDCSGSGPAR
jgi:hypothetical protein